MLPKRGRGRPKKQTEENVHDQKKNYDFATLPYGDLNYLTMPFEEPVPIEPLVEINTDLPEMTTENKEKLVVKQETKDGNSSDGKGDEGNRDENFEDIEDKNEEQPVEPVQQTLETVGDFTISINV